MRDLLHKGNRLQLRRAGVQDLDYIMKLEYDPENLRLSCRLTGISIRN